MAFRAGKGGGGGGGARHAHNHSQLKGGGGTRNFPQVRGRGEGVRKTAGGKTKTRRDEDTHDPCPEASV